MRIKVLLVMRRRILSDALIVKVSNDPEFTIIAEQNYAIAMLTAEVHSPDISLIEIPESGPWKSAVKCLAVCDAIRKQIPACKQVILCNENDVDSCRAVIRAKQEHRIDDFLFYDNSMNYLLSKIVALVETENNIT